MDTKLVLLEPEFTFDGALSIVKSKEEIENYLWPEEDYFVLNVVYKATKNPKKLVKSLDKYEKTLRNLSSKYLNSMSADYIQSKDREAFNAVQSYYENVCDPDELKAVIEPAIMIQRMLSKALEIFENNLIVDDYDSSNGVVVTIRSYAVFDYLRAILQASPNNYTIDARVLNAADFGAPQKRMRFVVMGIKKDLVEKVELPQGTFTEDNYRTVFDAIGDLEDVPTVTDIAEDVGTPLPKKDSLGELGNALRDTDVLKNHVVTKTRDTAMERFKALKQGQNFHSLDDSLKTNTYTDASRTQNTVYLRLNYNRPSGTVINVRKSMWVHPVLDRAVSIREAARLQTFPDSFVFCGSKDKQYQQVGNAVPPMLANVIAKSLIKQLNG